MSEYTKYTVNDKVAQRFKMVMGFIIRTLVLVIVIKYMVITPGRVQGVSMEPTFYSGDIFIANRAAYYIGEPKRYDVVQAIDPTDEKKLLIKRVIALPGEVITIVNNKVFVKAADGSDIGLDESYLPIGTITRNGIRTLSTMKIPDNSYYLLGDNRLASRDSRVIGPFHRKYINGIIQRITPQRITAPK